MKIMYCFLSSLSDLGNVKSGDREGYKNKIEVTLMQNIIPSDARFILLINKHTELYFILIVPPQIDSILSNKIA